MQYIFVHIPKNGGSSIVRADILRGVVEQPSRLTLSTPYLMSSGITRAWGHARWVNLDPVWRDSRPAFTLVRNPWSWMVSQFRFKKKILTEKGLETEGDPFHIGWSFDQFIEWLDASKDKPSFQHLNCHRTTCNIQSQKSFIVNESGRPVVDVLRFENFDEDTMKYLRLKQPLRPRNVTSKIHHDYKSYYTDDTRDWVNQQFSEDIDYFGYSFESGPTKNYHYS